MTPGSRSPSHHRWVISLWIEDARRQCELIDMGFQLALQRPFDYPTNDVLPKDFCGYLRYKDTSMKAILNRKCLQGLLHKADDLGSAKAFERYSSFLSEHKKSGKFAARKDNWKYYLWLMPCTSSKAVRFNCYHERVPCERPSRVLPEPDEVPTFSTSPLRKEESPDEELLSWMDEFSVSEINFSELHDIINKTCETSKRAVRKVERYDYKNYKSTGHPSALSLRTPSPKPPKGKGSVENSLSFLPPPSKVLSRDPSPRQRNSSPISLLDEEKLSSSRGGSERMSEEKSDVKGVYFQPMNKESTSKGERRVKPPIVFQPTPENNSGYVSPQLSPLRSYSRPRRPRSRSSMRKTRRDSFGRVVDPDDRATRSPSRSRQNEGSRSRSRVKRHRKRSRSWNKSRSKAQSTPCSRERSRSRLKSLPPSTKAGSSGSLKRHSVTSRRGRSRSRERSLPNSRRAAGNRGRSRSRGKTVPHSRGRSRSQREKSKARSRGRSPGVVKSIPRSSGGRSNQFHSRVRESRPRERSRSRVRKRSRLERRNHSVRERRRRSYSEKKKKKKKKKRKRYYDELHPAIPIVRHSRLEPRTDSDDDPAQFDSMLNEYLFADKGSD